jgi:hypothetical protein
MTTDAIYIYIYIKYTLIDASREGGLEISTEITKYTDAASRHQNAERIATQREQTYLLKMQHSSDIWETQ